MNSKYDIFISYRRTGGAQFARILQLMLIQRGFKVFLDYDELTDGVFSEKIRAAIKEAPFFMLVLSKGSMTRCVNDGDWVREEITLAVEQKKHIIPVNPDNEFDGFPDGMPKLIIETIGLNQHSEISFGQALGATIDLMISNRLVATLGKRVSNVHRDEDYVTAQGTLRRQDAHNRSMKRLGITCAVLFLMIVLGTCYWFWQHQRAKDAAEAEATMIAKMRTEIMERHKDFSLYLNDNLTKEQLNTIDTLLVNMSELYPDSIWISQYEFTVGQWYGILGESIDEDKKYLPMVNVSFGDINMLIGKLRDMTNLTIDLPSVEVWQYAARGGANNETSLYAGNNDVDKVSWYKENSDGHAHPTDGQQGKEPNMLDLYDMSGNVSEICNITSEGRCVVCGGNFRSPADEVAANSQQTFGTDEKSETVGFRIIIRKE
jgi:hypothetical protein